MKHRTDYHAPTDWPTRPLPMPRPCPPLPPAHLPPREEFDDSPTLVDQVVLLIVGVFFGTFFGLLIGLTC
ncbi:hypothetical protein GFY24_00940 [Nocardia sp. SYP-A9097]|uniref:hypothetical protein n=1 Tax=Nocardia sp. SYP-A9097 TaxID=2663237 RepID=UPI00129AF538|nr:hypothetical protein [Nocardia sp. SYP-A9097]MRH86043.1 hypothetical protein [Nocardia sp. SYP-A9097]